MTPQSQRPADTYSPIYFLAAVGAGGLAVTFFMYLLFWVPHPGRTVPVFEDIASAWSTGNLALQVAIAAAYIGIASFAVLNLRSLVWNLRRYSAFRKTGAFETLSRSNAQSSTLALPLALAMSVNVGFIVGLVFVPGLWSIVEYLFPIAMVTFSLIGILALRMIGGFLGRVLSKGGVFDVTAHNSFAQMLPAFALAMVAVGFAAPAAMSTVKLTAGISLIGSTFFGTAAVLYALLAAITAVNSMLHYGTARESGPTLLIIVPLMTVLGIMALRQDHGAHISFEAHGAAVDTLLFLTKLLSVQIAFALLGMTVLRRQQYFRDFIFGAENSPGSYALICPGVALSVMLQFWLHKGLLATGLIAKFSPAYWAVIAVALALQFAMVWLVMHLNRRHFGRARSASMVPAE